jgi:nitrate/nitrite transporter NarK
MNRRTHHRRWLLMMVLSLSGGIIFFLPFLQELYYRPLAVALQLNNAQIGSLLSVFGITSLLCYVPGGWLADRFSPRLLLSSSLISTGLSGFYFSTFPSYPISLLLHGFWGITITLMFWCAMLRVTRHWGAANGQGQAYGALEMGRGIGEALSAAATLTLFAYLGSDATALKAVIGLFSAIILGLGIASIFVLRKDSGGDLVESRSTYVNFDTVRAALGMPEVWLISAIVLSGYCAYWGTLRLTSYATDVFLLSVTLAALLSSLKLWVKPFAALGAGVLADKLGVTQVIVTLFIMLLLGFLSFAFLPGSTGWIPAMVLNLILVSIAVFGLRGIYFALVHESGIPFEVTGVAIGVISMIGLSPDIFMPLLGGMLLDTYQGAEGYQYFFLCVSGMCCLGIIATRSLATRNAGSTNGA